MHQVSSPTAQQIILPRVREHEYEIDTLMGLGARAKGDLISFDVADPSSDTPAHVKKAMVEALKRSDATHYSRIRGLPEFVESVSNFYHSKFGLKINAQGEVLATVGSGEALYIAFASTVSPGDEFILPNPTFPNYSSLLHLLGGIPKFVPVKEDFHLDADAISDAITNKTRAIVLCTPNNPTGAVYDRRELKKVLEIAEEKNLFVLSDENYSRVTYDGRRHFTIASLPNAMERTIVVNGLSKVYAMTGWRLGYLIARSDLIEQFEKIAYEIHGSVNTAVQYAGAAALRSPKRLIDGIVRQYDRRRRLMVELLKDAGLDCHYPEGGFEAFPKIPDWFNDSMEFTKFLVDKARVLVKPGIYFGPAGEKHVRLVYCGTEELIAKGLRRMKKALFEFSNKRSRHTLLPT